MLAALECLRSLSSPGRATPSVPTGSPGSSVVGAWGSSSRASADGGEPGGRQGRHDRAHRRTRSSCGASGARSRRRSGSSTRTWCRCSAHGEEGGLPYLVQALIPGGSLAERIVAEGKIGPGQHAAAARGRRGGDRRAARRRARPPRHQAGQHPARRRHAPTCRTSAWPRTARPRTSRAPARRSGSLDYMAPEQIRGEDVSPATDIYALGCVFIECLTGAPPFGGRPSMRVLFAHLQDAAARPHRAAARHPGRRGDARSTGRWRRSPRSARRAPRATSSPSRAPPARSEKVHLLAAGGADTVGR